MDAFEPLTEALAQRPDNGPVEYGGLVVFPAAAAVCAIRLGYGGDGRIQQVVAEFGDYAPKP